MKRLKQLYQELFYIPKHGKIRERVMVTRAVSTVVLILFFLSAMTLTAYSYFAVGVTSVTSAFQAAVFGLDITVTETVSGNTLPLQWSEGHVSASLTPGVDYVVRIAPTGTASTGFCIFTGSNWPQRYCTCQLGVDQDVPGGRTDELSFSLIVGEGYTQVNFFPHWGTSSYYSEAAGEFYLFGDQNAINVGYTPPPPEETPEAQAAEPETAAAPALAAAPEAASTTTETATAPEAASAATETASAPAQTSTATEAATVPEAASTATETATVPEAASITTETATAPEAASAATEAATAPAQTSTTETASAPAQTSTATETATAPEAASTTTETASAPAQTSTATEAATAPAQTSAAPAEG